MKQAVLWFIVVVGFVAILVGALGRLADNESRRLNAEANLAYARGRARAVVIEAQGQARLDSAQASAVTLTAALPWGVLGVLGLLGLSLSALAMAMVVMSFLKSMQPPPVIERQVIMLPPPGPRRQTWQTLTQVPDDYLVIPAKTKHGGRR
jgi:hypothetical protein